MEIPASGRGRIFFDLSTDQGKMTKAERREVRKDEGKICQLGKNCVTANTF
jgi:hypothetical protein